MPHEGPGPYYLSGQPGTGAPNFRVRQTVNARLVGTSVQWATGTALAERQVKPGAVNVTTVPASETTPQDFGYNWLIADLDATADLPALRRIEAGTWTFTVVLEPSVVDVQASTQVHVRLHKRSAAGALVNLASSALSTGQTALAAVEQTHVCTLAPGEVFLGAGVMLQVEIHVKSKGAVAAAQTIIVVSGTPTLQPVATSFVMPGAGLRYRFDRPTGGDAAPASDAAVRIAKWPRALADSSPATDAVTRSIAVTRGLAESAPAVDAAARIGRWPRTVDDGAPAADALTRIVRYVRAVSELAPADDVVARSIVVMRALADSAPAVDAVDRIARWPRSLEEQIGPAEAPPASPLPVVIYRGKALVSIGGGLYV